MASTTTETAAHKRLRVHVDPIRCTAFGFCAEFCPELFDLDDWGYAWLKEREIDGSAERLIRETARLCPRKAILVEEIEGRDEPRAAAAAGTSRRTITLEQV